MILIKHKHVGITRDATDPAWIRGRTKKVEQKIREFPKRNSSAERERTFLAESSKEFFTAEPSHLSIFTGLSSIFHCNGNQRE